MAKYTIGVLEGLLARKCYAISDAEQIAILEAISVLRSSGWVRTSERLPDGKCELLFVVYTPEWTDTTKELSDTDEVIPAENIVVSGRYQPLRNKRYWSWTDWSENVIKNEYSQEECGSKTYITHWMPFPLPPLPEVDNG